MQMKPQDSQMANIVNAYGGGGFRISGVHYEGSVIIGCGQVLPWDCGKVEDIDVAALDLVFGKGNVAPQDRPEILLVGCGQRFMLLPKSLAAWASAWKIMIEGMDTGAAARTYNVLRQEGRAVAAALMAVE